MNPQSDFLEFLKFTESRKEISLAIAKDETELTELKDILERNHFRKATQVSQLMLHMESAAKVYFVISDQISKDLYDFIVQYPTGRVQIFDASKMKSNIAVPSYKDVSIVLLLTKETISKLEKSQFQILEIVGITYQS